jgi:protein-L-isoaspartate O-methyltransferase
VTANDFERHTPGAGARAGTRAAASLPTTAAWLGYGGLIPFILLAIAAGLGLGRNPEWPAAASLLAQDSRALLAYGAVILSFVGALHWGFAMTLRDLPPRSRNTAFLWSVVPALLAWVALVLPPAPAVALLILGFLAQYRRDVGLARLAALPAWYLPLRLRLTTVACVSLVLGGFAAEHWIAPAHAAITPAITTANASADSPAHYREVPASIDGTGRIYEGREIAQVMGYEGAAWLDRPTREQEERPDLMIDALGLQPGMTVADIGAGSGYVSRRLAARVAPGRVWAVDVQPQMVAMLENLSRQPGMTNIIPHISSADNVMLPDASMDLAVLVDVYHELAFPYEIMQSLVRALKPGGRLVLVEYRAEDAKVPIKPLHKMTVAQVKREMSRWPLIWDHTDERLPLQHVIVFRKPLD